MRRTAIVAICLALVGLVGYLDYLSGVENSMLLLYLVPIALATWHGGFVSGLIISFVSVGAWLLADLSAGMPRINAWNVGTALGAYAFAVLALTRWNELLKRMHVQVEQRTASLRRELTERKRLEAELEVVTERERDRVGRELHDNLCQHLIGTSLLAQTFSLQAKSSNTELGSKADQLVSLIDGSLELTRQIARGLLSSDLQSEGLSSALEEMARSITQEHGIDCRFAGAFDLEVDRATGYQLYWIAREAATNAVKHGRAQHIAIDLVQENGTLQLSVRDDGAGLVQLNASSTKGVGLKLMAQRARLAGGTFQIEPGRRNGVVLRCEVPVQNLK